MGISQGIQKSIISSAGETYNNDDVQLDWTIGELSINQYLHSSILVNEGFHQKNEKNSQTTAISNFQLIEDIHIGPNPTNKYLYIRTSIKESLKYSVYDLNGVKRNASGSWVHGQSIMVDNLISGVYILKLEKRDGSLGIYTFIKS